MKIGKIVIGASNKSGRRCKRSDEISLIFLMYLQHCEIPLFQNRPDFPPPSIAKSLCSKTDLISRLPNIAKSMCSKTDLKEAAQPFLANTTLAFFVIDVAAILVAREGAGNRTKARFGAVFAWPTCSQLHSLSLSPLNLAGRGSRFW